MARDVCITGIISTIAGNGTVGYTGDGGAATAATLSNPTGVAVDSLGQVYILSNAPSVGPTQAVRKVGVAGHWYFGSQLLGTGSVSKVFTVANTGNDTLTLAANAFFNGSNPSDFAVDPATTTCSLSSGATLQPGHSCYIGVIFTPSASGSRSANLQLLDNTVTGTNTIWLTGTGTLPKPTVKITSPASGSTVTHGSTVTFSVSVTSTLVTKPTGTVTFKVNGTAIGSPVIFLHLCQKVRGFDPCRGSARTWIVQIAYRRAFDRRAYLQRRKFYDGTDVGPLTNNLMGAAAFPADVLIDAEKLRASFGELNEKQRKTLELFFFEGMELRDISIRLNETFENTRHYYYRGLERLRRGLISRQDGHLCNRK
jgi:DNA-directed RNA polymerase specialized sigma24 family protein